MTSKKQLARRKERKIQLEFDKEVKQDLKDLSVELGVSQSQIAQFFVMTGLQNINVSKSTLSRYLEPSPSPLWQFRINFDRLKKDLGG